MTKQKEIKEGIAREVCLWHIGKPSMWEAGEDNFIWEGPLKKDYYEAADMLTKYLHSQEVVISKQGFNGDLMDSLMEIKEPIAEPELEEASKCPECDDKGFIEHEHGLIAVLCDCEAGKKKKAELGMPEPNGGQVLPPKNIVLAGNEPVIPLSEMVTGEVSDIFRPIPPPEITMGAESEYEFEVKFEELHDSDSGTGQPDSPTGSTDTSQPKQPRKRKAKKKAGKGTR